MSAKKTFKCVRKISKFPSGFEINEPPKIVKTRRYILRPFLPIQVQSSFHILEVSEIRINKWHKWN